VEFRLWIHNRGSRMGFKYVARFVICGLAISLQQPVMAQDPDKNIRGWRQGAIEHAQRMRKYRDFNSGTMGPPSVILKRHLDWDATGVVATYQPAGPTFTAQNAFFKDLGTNGRTCFTCHQPQEGWSFSAAGAHARFEASSGADPLFRVVDGATCPTDPVATLDDKRNAYKLVIEKGLIRVGLPLPASDLEFEVTSVEDPYRCSTNPDTGLTSPTEGIVSIYRRPLPSTNLGFIAGIMWDGREPTLESQAADATRIHAQADTALDDARQAQMVGFEKGLYTAQIFDNLAKRLDAEDATGGPVSLSMRQFHIGINDPNGADSTNGPFNPKIFDLYRPWAGVLGEDQKEQRRRSVARGELVFNSGFCGRCHNTPDVGSRSVDAFLNIGVADADNPPGLDIAGLPVFTLTCTKGANAGQVFKVTDPGRALITGKCSDIGRFKAPVLRGLASRAPYFHNGAAPTLVEVVEFYSRRFTLDLTAEQKADLVNFLETL
jgi:cytochrome c peroxidase